MPDVLNKLLSTTTALAVICILLVFAGIIFLTTAKKDSLLAPYSVQVLGLCFVLPTIAIIASTSQLDNAALTALLGSIVGYLFGTATKSDASKTGGSGSDRADNRNASDEP